MPKRGLSDRSDSDDTTEDAPPTPPTSRSATPPASGSDDDSASDNRLLTHANLLQLSAEGYTVIPGVVSRAVAEGLRSDMVALVHALEPRFVSEDFRTYSFLPHSVHGLFQSYRAGQSLMAWKARELMAPVFAEYYHCWPEELVTSMDAFGFIPPGKRCTTGSFTSLLSRAPSAMWPHFDSGPKRAPHIHARWHDSAGWTIQSELVLVDSVRDSDASLVVWPRSHLDFPAFCAAESRNLGPRAAQDWIKLTNEQYERGLTGAYGHPWVPTRVSARAGDMILWNSATLHQNVRPVRSQHAGRAVVFACMQPRAWATAEQLAAKRKALLELRTTSHNPLETRCFAEVPYTHGREHPSGWTSDVLRKHYEALLATPSTMTPLQLRLAGFD
jgi:hypothetical protein